MQSVLAAQLAEVRYGPMGHRLRLIWVSDMTSKRPMVNCFLSPIVQTRSERSGNKDSRSYWAPWLLVPGSSLRG